MKHPNDPWNYSRIEYAEAEAEYGTTVESCKRNVMLTFLRVDSAHAIF